MCVLAETSTSYRGIPQEVAQLEQAVIRFRQAAMECNARLDEASRVERAARGLAAVSGECVSDSSRVDAEAAAGRARYQLWQMATREFAVPGAPFCIALESVPYLDPIALWQFFSEKYGEGRSLSVAYAPVAKELVSALRIEPGEEIRMVGGRFCFKKYIQEAKGLGLEFSSADRLKTILGSFLTIATWSDCWTANERDATKKLIEETRSYGPMRTMRAEIGNDVLIVPCRSSWDFRLSPQFAEKMQMFIAEFGGFAR